MSTRWKPEIDDRYWYVSEEIDLRQRYYSTRYDVRIAELGNCFKTREQAEAALEKIKQILKEAHDEQSNF